MEINYKKNNNMKLFNNDNKNLLNLLEIQNYIPIFNNFFNLNNSNFNNFNLNYSINLTDIKCQETYNTYKCVLTNSETNEEIVKDIFFKFSPLLDPIKFISNKYDLSKNLIYLPEIDTDKNTHFFKLLDYNNSAYVDGFFTFLTSKLLHKHNFIHGIDCYGTFLGIKKDFLLNINDDTDYLFNCEDFHKNNNNLYKFINNQHNERLNHDTRNNKKKLNLENIKDYSINLSDISELNNLNDIFIQPNSLQESFDISNNIIFESNINIKSNNTNSSKSTCSSRSSNTADLSEEMNESSSTSNDLSEESSCESDVDEEINIQINKFPIKLIALELCNNTLDSYIANNNIKDDELDSIVLQILMILITYQKIFKMTHNDLHTNNIMYIETNKKYLYYKVNNKHYKIPTFGKIYKIIDFGRAIYSFKGVQICSDSFHKEGDAATQYNFGVYKDDNKPIVEPNYSFDLCRLGCSIFDFFVEDLDDFKNIKSSIKKIILNWCFDNKDRNILYKNNGEERYPDFKLYKMISRTVTNHIPNNELQNIYFNKYQISKKLISKKNFIFNIDELPTYY